MRGRIFSSSVSNVMGAKMERNLTALKPSEPNYPRIPTHLQALSLSHAPFTQHGTPMELRQQYNPLLAVGVHFSDLKSYTQDSQVRPIYSKFSSFCISFQPIFYSINQNS